jgi:surface polysaccharide O-acyltransferase-like enzyme
VPSFLVGFAISFGGFLWRVFESAGGTYPVGGMVDMAVWWETTWCNDTIGVVLMSVAWILLFKKCKAEGSFYQKVLLPVSNASYGIYLAHLLILVPVCGFFRNQLGIGLEGSLGVWTTPVQIVASALCGFILTAIVSLIIRRIPKIGRLIVG